jgi:hypothetical protein
MAEIQPLVIEIPMIEKEIKKEGVDAYTYCANVIRKIMVDNKLGKTKRVGKNDRYNRILEFKTLRGNTAIYEIRYEKPAKVGNTAGEDTKTPTKDHGFGI